MKKWCIVLLFIAAYARAQDEPVATARRLAQKGDRAQAIAILQQRLIAAPNDTDARTLYGTILSWNREYGRARQELETVLQQQPQNLDARLALARVEVWSGQARRAEELLRSVNDTADVTALRAQARREAITNEVSVGGTIDDYRHSSTWREAEIDLKHTFAFGPALLRGAHGSRFGLNDNQVELELYPRLGARSYAEIDGGYASKGDLYPRSRFGGEVFVGFGAGYEASIGERRLNFSNAVNITTTSLSKYYRDWLFTFRGYHVESGNSAQVLVRRYLGSAANYVGLRVGKGSTRDEIRSTADIQSFSSVEVALEARHEFASRWSFEARAGGGSQSGAGHRLASLLLGARF